MAMKVFLVSDEESIPLSQEVTTIGRADGCNVVINDCHLDPEHSNIEFSKCANKIIIHDLNTTSGTYVNGCRIQNSVVEIGQGDVVKFGYHGKPMKVVIKDMTQQKQNPYVDHVQQNDMMSSRKCSQYHFPPTERSKSPVGTTLPALNLKTANFAKSSPFKSSCTSLEDVVVEKERKLIQMGDEISRLSIFETESKQKDKIIASLRQHAFAKKSHCGGGGASSEAPAPPHPTVQHPPSSMLFSKISEAEKKNQELRGELETSRRNYECSQGLVQSLQGEVSKKDVQLKKNSTQLESLKRQLKQQEMKISALSSRCAKLTDEAAKNNQTDTLEGELKELRSKYKAQETRFRNQVELLQTYKDELGKLTHTCDVAVGEKTDALKKLQDAKQRLFELQRTEKLLRVDCEQIKSQYDRFRMKMTCLVNSVDLESADPLRDDLPDDGMLINRLQKVFRERTELRTKRSELEEQVKKLNENNEKRIRSQEECEKTIQLSLDKLDAANHTTRVLEEEKEKVQAGCCHDDGGGHAWVSRLVCGLLDCELRVARNTEQVLLSVDVNPRAEDKSAGEYIADVHGRYTREREARERCEEEARQQRLDHDAELHRVSSQIRLECLQTHSADTEKMRDDERRAYEEAMQAKTLQLTADHEKVKLQQQKRLDAATVEIEKLCRVIQEKTEEMNQLMEKLASAQQTIDEQNASEKSHSGDLATMEEACQASIKQIEADRDRVTLECAQTCKQYEEEVRQHTITIVTLEKKLQDYQRMMKARDESKMASVQTSNPPPVEVQEAIEMLKAEVLALKSELFLANQHIQVQADTNAGLRRDLKGAESRLSDMTGELSEAMKEELEYNRNLVRSQQLDLSETEQRLLKLSALVDAQKCRIEELESSRRGSSSSLVAASSSQLVQQQPASEHGNDDEVRQQVATHDQACEVDFSSAEDENPSVAEPRCHGERHADIIMRQREALAELRAQVKALEQIQPPLPSQEQALQQVVLLKKELAEIRAKQALEEDKELKRQLAAQGANQDTHHLLMAATAQASLERSSKDQLNDTVIASEKTYMDLSSALKALLGIAQLSGGARSMCHIPRDEREKLCGDRKQDLELISSYVKSISQRLDQKERLLQDYEKDLGKFREAESVATQKTEQLTTLRNNLISKSDEVNHLRRVLEETRNRLEIEERKNFAIKQRKTHNCKELMPPAASAAGDYPSYHLASGPSPPPASSSRQQKTSKRQSELRKRRQYELDVLKHEAAGRERQLCETTAKLINLENTLKKSQVS